MAVPSARLLPRLAAPLLAFVGCLPTPTRAAPSTGTGECSVGVGPAACVRDDLVGGPGAALGLLQQKSDKQRSSAAAAVVVESEEQRAPGAGAGEGPELVLQHIPYNFGHTTEKIAAFGTGEIGMARYLALEGELEASPNTQARWALVRASLSPGSQIWGHLNPDLFQRSEVTGCPLYFTPGKYWPTDMAQSYFGNKTIFGMLRDPYERLVAMFRGEFKNYGGSYPEFFKTCDVNGAVRKMMTDYLAGDMYAADCTFIPQAEYFDEPFGINLAIDNRRFPDSLNEVFAERGYPYHIAKDDILHVLGCTEVWAGDLDCETKALVKQVYARDFELLCKNFGYCDQEENCCIKGVPMMCPSNLEEKRKTATNCSGASSQ